MARVLQQGVFFFNLGMFFLFGRLLCVWKTLDLKKKKKKKECLSCTTSSQYHTVRIGCTPTGRSSLCCPDQTDRRPVVSV